MKKLLLGSLRLKWLVNGLYAYLAQLMHLFLDLMPGLVRKPLWKLLLGSLGRNVFIDYRVYFKYPWLVKIGDAVSVNRGTEFYPDFFSGSTITLGNNIRIGPNVRFHAAGHSYEDVSFPHTGDDIEICDDVWLGASVIVLQGVRVGPRSVVAAGSVVTKDLEGNAVYAGIPAREIRKI